MYLEKGTQTKNNLCHTGVDDYESLSITCPVNSISMASKFSGPVVQKMTIRYPYLRKEATGVRLGDRNFGLAAVIVQTLTKDFQWTRSNVACGNYFTNLSLAKTLAKQNLTIVGTVKRNKTLLSLRFQQISSPLQT